MDTSGSTAQGSRGETLVRFRTAVVRWELGNWSFGFSVPGFPSRPESASAKPRSEVAWLFKATVRRVVSFGSNLAWFGVDEMTYTQEGAWIRLEARLRDPEAKRLCGFGAWTPKGFDWV